MTKLKIKGIIWNEFNLGHIKKHNVTREDVEKVISTDVNITEGYLERKILTTRLGARLLSVVIAFEKEGFYVVSARDASSKEREAFYEYEKEKGS